MTTPQTLLLVAGILLIAYLLFNYRANKGSDIEEKIFGNKLNELL